jgi:hypothetical protein
VKTINSVPVAIDSDVTGLEWSVPDLDALARVIGVITLGQIQHASHIISTLDAATPAYKMPHLIEEAKAQMRLRGSTPNKRRVSRTHRDGYLFECISWIVARQNGSDRTYLKDPHLDATNHGLDGLVIDLAANKPKIIGATICEDKCTSGPRAKFLSQVMKTFGEHHARKRQRDLLANAASLIRLTGLAGTDADLAAAAVTDFKLRTYRAALTTVAPFGQTQRQSLFAGYVQLGGIQQSQRVGAVLPIAIPLRVWFELLARRVIAALDAF